MSFPFIYHIMPKKKFAVMVRIVIEAKTRPDAMRKLLKYGITAPHPQIQVYEKDDFPGPVLELSSNEKPRG
jgi:hypothetical protein